MKSALIRQKFLDFFRKKDHEIVPSAPLVLKNDPSLLFTNSGMVQFKDYFLGNSVPRFNRIADTQKCLRVSGKHNDLEDVGHDTYHHTMFEMLGNWSFGGGDKSYFKSQAISWAWELLTDEYNLPKDRLYATVFEGDKIDDLTVDDEAEELWKKFLPKDQIIYGDSKDNFWEMADVGPCGPCSEIHIDLRPDSERAIIPGRDLVNQDNPQVVEIWNLVFIQFERTWREDVGGNSSLIEWEKSYTGSNFKKDRDVRRKQLTKLKTLPSKHVDTGMGFERLCMAIQGKTSNYDTDLFSDLINNVAEIAGTRYGLDEKKDIAIRVIADHIRAITFAIADGQLPSNNGAGYVIRRILRRAVRYAYSYLNIKKPFLTNLLGILHNQFKGVFPELESQYAFVNKVIEEEEKSFLLTLEKGLLKIEIFFESVKEQREFHNTDYPMMVTGDVAFELYDTFGFPFDLTSLIARERGFSVDEKGFNEEMSKQKSRSKADATKETGDWNLVGTEVKTEFIGYEYLTAEVRIVKYRKVKQKNKELFQLVLDKTPFYAESGGQVGDTGVLETANERISIIDTKKENELIVHYTETFPENVEAMFHVSVNESQRRQTMNNHSATHLLHAALRQVLGKHVEQKGSLVNEKILRFDFSHFAGMTEQELEKVETIVNQKIRENIALNEQRNVPLEKAKSLGAMALFGEKYGEFVRVITFDPKFSVELCGGTHVPFTGNIGLLKIVSESSVAAGVRRIEAVTADGAQQYLNDNLKLLNEVKAVLKNPKDVLASAKSLMEEKHALEKKLEVMYQQQANVLKDELARKATKSNGHSLIVEKISVPTADTLKNIAYALRNQFDDLILILAADVDGKPQVAVMLGEKTEAAKKYHAGNMVKELAKEIDGGGGGQPFFATAGGKKLEGLDGVLIKAKQLI